MRQSESPPSWKTNAVTIEQVKHSGDGVLYLASHKTVTPSVKKKTAYLIIYYMAHSDKIKIYLQ